MSSSGYGLTALEKKSSWSGAVMLRYSAGFRLSSSFLTEYIVCLVQSQHSPGSP